MKIPIKYLAFIGLFLSSSCAASESQNDIMAEIICGPVVAEITVKSINDELHSIIVSRGYTVYTNEMTVYYEGNNYRVRNVERYFDGDEVIFNLTIGSGDINREILGRMMGANEVLSTYEKLLIHEAIMLHKLIAKNWPINEKELQEIANKCDSSVWIDN